VGTRISLNHRNIDHLVLEKTLKAFYVKDNGNSPPYLHNLIRLAENTSLFLTDEMKQCLMEINDFHIEARYPDTKHSFYELCSKEFATAYFTKIKEIYKWLLSQMV